MHDVVILIPAAGSASRMRGRDKLLEDVEGIPLLRRVTEQACATGLSVLVTLPDHATERHKALAGLTQPEVRLLENASEGMAVSLRTGAGWAQAHNARGLMVLPGDMPEVETQDFITMAQSFAQEPDQILRAVDETGAHGHPVVLPARLFAQIKALKGDRGAGPIVAKEQPRTCPLPGRRATLDLDTPEAWAAWRAGK